MLHAVKAGNGEVVIASHNEQSVLTAMSLMEELGLDNHNAGVMFGQLQGMCDFLTYSLSAKGYHSYKYELLATVVVRCFSRFSDS